MVPAGLTTSSESLVWAAVAAPASRATKAAERASARASAVASVTRTAGMLVFVRHA